MKDAAYWIKALRLEKHPEGGYYREIYRAAESIPSRALPARFAGDRPFSTAICFLLPAAEISAFHRLKADEVWHFYLGKNLSVFEITTSGELVQHVLGRNPEKGESFQAVIRAGSWLAAEVRGRSGFSLVGCTVAPGFDFADFELGSPVKLRSLYPRHEALVSRLSHAGFGGRGGSARPAVRSE